MPCIPASVLNLYDYHIFIILYSHLDALKDIKDQFFYQDGDGCGFEPSCGLVSIADGTYFCIGQLLAASVCNGGPPPAFLAPWVYDYLIDGMAECVKFLPNAISSSWSDIYKKVIFFLLLPINFETIFLLSNIGQY